VTKLTVRLHNERTGQLLAEVAKRYGVSKNQLIEQLLERELQAAAMVIEQDLITTIEQLRRYRTAEHQKAAIEAVAQAESLHPDPMQARRGSVAGTDAFGILDTFAGA
jgi:Ni2+-binding GTPase involved in maturation of urease and hydrogenase